MYWFHRRRNPSGSEAARSAEETCLNGEEFLHDAHVLLLGEEGAARFEQRSAAYYREQDYAADVERKKRLVELRRRELAADAELSSLR